MWPLSQWITFERLNRHLQILNCSWDAVFHMWFGAALVFLFILFYSIFCLMQIDVFLRVLLFCLAQSRFPFYYLRRNVHVISNISVVSHTGCKLIDIWIYSIFAPVRIVFKKFPHHPFVICFVCFVLAFRSTF